MSHQTVWQCDRCKAETRIQTDVVEVEARGWVTPSSASVDSTEARPRPLKRQHDLCLSCAEDLTLFLGGASVDVGAPCADVREAVS